MGTSTEAIDLGNLIMSGFVPGPTGGGAAEFTGGAGRRLVPRGVVVGLGIALGGLGEGLWLMGL